MNKEKKDIIMLLYFIILVLVSFVFLEVTFVSANGLNITYSNDTITKIYNTTQNISLNIKNTDSFTFYNISIENNNYISFSQIPQLDSGQSINISAAIIGNSDFNGLLKIKGYYIQNIGVQNKTWDINITYPDGVDKCSLSIIRGDKVTFHSLVNDNVELINQDTSSSISSIPALGTYTINFDNPQIINYATKRIGFIFPSGQTCRISCLSDTGSINDPNLDGLLYLKLKMSYNPTVINYSQFVSNYSMDFFDTKQDALSITNIGNNTAKNITLIGDWFTFNKNNFDLNVNETTTIVYTLKPKIGYTNDTNKTWIQNFTIKGNFNEVFPKFNIFINYANIDSGNLNLSGSNQTFMDYVCSVYPQFCQNNTIIIYRTVDNGSNTFNVSMSQDQVSQIWQKIFSDSDARKLVDDWLKEQALNNTQNYNTITASVADLKSQFNIIQEKQKQNDDTWFFITFAVLLLIIAILIGFGGWYMIRQANAKRKEIM